MLNNIVLDSVVQYLLENKETIYNSIKIMWTMLMLEDVGSKEKASIKGGWKM